MTMTPTIRKPDDPTVHLKDLTTQGIDVPQAVCGRIPDPAGLQDILVDTLNDDPVVDCDVCRELSWDEDDTEEDGDD